MLMGRRHSLGARSGALAGGPPVGYKERRGGLAARPMDGGCQGRWSPSRRGGLAARPVGGDVRVRRAPFSGSAGCSRTNSVFRRSAPTPSTAEARVCLLPNEAPPPADDGGGGCGRPAGRPAGLRIRVAAAARPARPCPVMMVMAAGVSGQVVLDLVLVLDLDPVLDLSLRVFYDFSFLVPGWLTLQGEREDGSSAHGARRCFKSACYVR
jgi:hypothetical protein